VLQNLQSQAQPSYFCFRSLSITLQHKTLDTVVLITKSLDIQQPHVSSKMDRIPQEVMDMIVRCASDVDYSHKAWPWRLWKEGESQVLIPFIKALRLCNRRLANMTAPYLYKEVILHFSEESFNNMAAVSDHPTYRHYVRGLHIVPKAISGPKLDRAEFEEWLHGKRTLTSNDDVYYLQEGQSGSSAFLQLPHGFHLTPAKVDFHFDEYSLQYRKQLELLATAENRMVSAVSRFPRLRRVEPGSYWYWNRVRNQYIPGGEGNIPGEWTSSSCQTKFDMDQGTMLLKTLANGISVSQAQVDTGPLFMEFDTTAMDILDLDQQPAVLELLSHVKVFNHAFNVAHYEEVLDFVYSNRFAAFFNSMPNIEDLTISFYENVSYELPKLFGQTTWQNLTSLSIEKLHVIDQDHLAAMLQRHRSTLKYLTMFDLSVIDNKWYNVFAVLKGSALEKLRFYSNINKMYANEATTCCNEDWLPRSNPICEFLFDNRPSSHLMEQEANWRSHNLGFEGGVIGDDVFHLGGRQL